MEIKKKKIAFIIGALTPGGAERVISTLSNELINDFEVFIIIFRKTDPFYPLDIRIKVISCFDQIKKPTSILGSIMLNYRIMKRVSSIVKNEKINLLIGFITSANIITTLVAKRNNIPCLISERSDPLRNDIPLFWKVLRKFAYPMANNLIVQTERVKAVYLKKFGLQNITVLPNPISSQLSNLRKFNVKREQIILNVGRLTYAKGQEKLIKAVHTLNLKGWKIIIIGKGPDREKLNKLIKHYKLTDQIKILSNIKNIHEYYIKSSIFIFTSNSEGFPNALMEAMHFGLACVSTDCNYGPSDLIIDGKNGYLVPVNDQSLLEKKLDELVKNESVRFYFSENAMQTSMNYTSNKIVLQWKSIISDYI